MPGDYPWYEIVDGEGLEQGDILKACPILLPAYVDDDSGIALAREHAFQRFDIVILTQSCDLVNDKLSEVIVCPHWDLSGIGKVVSTLASKNTQAEILKGRRARYTMLGSCELKGAEMDVRIVDLGNIHTLPKEALVKLAAVQSPRLRLRSPYREHLSQAFARFFMRVGLPQNIVIP